MKLSAAKNSFYFDKFPFQEINGLIVITLAGLILDRVTSEKGEIKSESFLAYAYRHQLLQVWRRWRKWENGNLWKWHSIDIYLRNVRCLSLERKLQYPHFHLIFRSSANFQVIGIDSLLHGRDFVAAFHVAFWFAGGVVYGFISWKNCQSTWRCLVPWNPGCSKLICRHFQPPIWNYIFTFRW